MRESVNDLSDQGRQQHGSDQLRGPQPQTQSQCQSRESNQQPENRPQTHLTRSEVGHTPESVHFATTATATTTAGDGLRPSSATAGFFQSFPVLPPQYTAADATTASNVASPRLDDTATQATPNEAVGVGDVALRRALALYLPTPLPTVVDQRLHELARICVAPSTLRFVVDAEVNVPSLNPLDTFGQVNETNALRVGEGWRALKNIGIRAGSVALGYGLPSDTPDPHIRWNKRVHQFATNHLWGASAALVTCPAAMSDGGAVLLRRHLQDADGDQIGRGVVLSEAYKRLVSFDPDYAWTSGQWMTERSGGSDVSGTETTATRLTPTSLEAEKQSHGCDEDHIGMPLGPWKIDGFKWFSSATDADMVVLLARTAKGISVFYAPMRRRRGDKIVMNGVRITRLKQKLGTKSLPTSELEIKGMRAWLIGVEGKGTKEISPILNTTRLWTAAGAVGGWSRGLAIARAYSSVRHVKGRPLLDNAQHVRWMADETVKYRAAVSFVFLGVALNGVVEDGPAAVTNTRAASFMPSDPVEAERLLRVLTPVMKAQCSLASVAGLREIMESLGGVGYCENNEDGGILNIARLYRDCNVNPIWEGTVSVMAEDFVRVVKGQQQDKMLHALDGLIRRLLRHDQVQVRYAQESAYAQQLWHSLLQDLRASNHDQLLYRGRHLLSQTAELLCTCLLVLDASVDENEVAVATARRWTEMVSHRDGGPGPLELHQQHGLDRAIFLGEVPQDVALRARM